MVTKNNKRWVSFEGWLSEGEERFKQRVRFEGVLTALEDDFVSSRPIKATSSDLEDVIHLNDLEFEDDVAAIDVVDEDIEDIDIEEAVADDPTVAEINIQDPEDFPRDIEVGDILYTVSSVDILPDYDSGGICENADCDTIVINVKATNNGKDMQNVEPHVKLRDLEGRRFSPKYHICDAINPRMSTALQLVFEVPSDMSYLLEWLGE